MDKRQLVYLALFSFFSSPVWAAYSLLDCYKSAVQKNEVVEAQKQVLVQAKERSFQSKGSLGPSLTGYASYTRLPKPDSAENAFTKYERPEVRIGLTQPIFHGGAEYGLLKSYASLEEAQESKVKDTELKLYMNVATSFLDVWTYKSDIDELNHQLEINKTRVEELKERTRIGRSRKAEVLSVQASVAALEAQIAETTNQWVTAKEQLSFLTGIPVERLELASLETKSAQAYFPTYEKESLPSVLKKVEERPDLKEAALKLDSAEDQVTVARAGHFPTIDATGNYYLKRVGVLESQKWDVAVQLSLPLFRGGTTFSQTTEKAAAARAAELELANLRRAAAQEVRTLYQKIKNTAVKLSALENAANLAEKNYKVQNKEYGLGLVNNLEVLQAINNFIDTKRNLNKTRYTYFLDRLKLAAALGRGPSL